MTHPLSRPRASSLLPRAATTLCSVSALLMASAVQAQDADAALPAYGAAAGITATAVTPTVYTDLGALSGNRNLVSLTRVPVKTSTGAVIYKDITVQFDVADDGTLSLSAGFPKYVTSAALSTSNFRAGNYKDSFGNKYVVAGPGVLASGRTKWTLNWVPPTGKTGELSMTWATGAVVGSPFEATLKYWGITASTYSWGLVGTLASGTGGFPNPPFSGYYPDRPIGAWQTGDQLEIHNFVNGGEASHLFLTRCVTAC